MERKSVALVVGATSGPAEVPRRCIRRGVGCLCVSEVVVVTEASVLREVPLAEARPLVRAHERREASSVERGVEWQRASSAVLGLALIVTAGGVTVLSTIAEKPLSGVGVGGLFVAGLLLLFAGLLGLLPSSLTFGKDGATVQFVAEAVKEMKQSAREIAQQATADAFLLERIKAARSDQDAAAAVASVARQIVDAMPATADITARLRHTP
jgi:hypothetical protein